VGSTSAWSIDPVGVVAVLTSVKDKATLLGDALSSLEGDLTSAVQGSQSQAIADAVQAWMGTEAPGLEGVSTRITAAVTGASEATNAYVQGDLDMAADAQAYQVTAAVRGQHWEIHVNKGMY
jgi:hypothetical protein